MGKISRFIGSMFAGSAIALGGAALYHQDEIKEGYQTYIMKSESFELEKKIKVNPRNQKEFKLYTDMKPQFAIIGDYLSVKNDMDILKIKQSMTQILNELENRKNTYGPGNAEYNYIIQYYEPNLKIYFKYVISELKVHIKSYELDGFEIK